MTENDTLSDADVQKLVRISERQQMDVAVRHAEPWRVQYVAARCMLRYAQERKIRGKWHDAMFSGLDIPVLNGPVMIMWAVEIRKTARITRKLRA